MPEIHLIVNAKVSDLSGLENIEQVTSLIDVELSELNENEDNILIIPLFEIAGSTEKGIGFCGSKKHR